MTPVKKSKKISKKTKKSSKKNNRRSRAKYPALNKSLNLISRQDLIDYDYIHKLNEKELEWLNKFTEEYVNASISKDRPLHRTKKLRKDCYTRNNKRNNDVLFKARDNHAKIEDTINLHMTEGENDVIERIDVEKIEAILENLIKRY